ncbi:hypothetical protein GKE82_06440 [Conexibacter sp. W3-3-2]|uniref:hypothetical protein n=1 Tax=Conexibacter sp. W3-3-2 TaxID=2675227 RepID=UPI0012B96588|nr:hypothetical protein [Conexibacter sp. W3-3-2]MTD43949.1 hypothetical protein [Conexibacter sp. W3-3-2]
MPTVISPSVTSTPTVAVRTATPQDLPALRRLAALETAPVPTGDVLVGVVDGDVVAAVPVGGGRPVADPFRHTADIVSMLEIRAARLGRPAATDAHPRRPARLMRRPFGVRTRSAA